MARPAPQFEKQIWRRPTGGWGIIFLGALSIIGGAVALTHVLIASLVSATFLGSILVILGAILVAHSFQDSEWYRVAGHAVIGVLWVILGIGMWLFPAAGLISLTLLITILLVVSGIARISFSFWLRQRNWAWTLTSGIISLVLAGFIIAEWPMSAVTIPGIFLGVDLIFYGLSLLSLGALTE